MKDSEVRLRFQWILCLKMKRSIGGESGEVVKAWKELKECVMNVTMEVQGTKRCGNEQKERE